MGAARARAMTDLVGLGLTLVGSRSWPSWSASVSGRGSRAKGDAAGGGEAFKKADENNG